MEKNYNYTRRKVFLPEYGRHIHEMVDYLGTIDDRDERTRQAHVVIDVMGNLNPLLRDTSDIAHKLWDHLFIMADFDLDVDSPYPIPTRKDLRPQPDKLEYPKKNIMFKHYGKSVERMINSLRDNPDQKAVEETLENIARYMRTKSYEYNQEHPNNEIIIGDIKRMSRGHIEMDEAAIGALKSEYKAPVQHNNKRQGGKGGKNGKNARGGQGQQGHGQGQRRGPRSFVWVVVVMLASFMASCDSGGARVSGQLIGAGDQPVYLEQVVPSGGEAAADTVMTSAEGKFSFAVHLPDGQPTIYNLRNGDDMVPLLVSPRERVEVMSFGDLGEGYRVSGSPASEKVWELHGILSRGAAALDSISSLYALSGPDEARQRLSRAYVDKYLAIKRQQIRFIVENSSSLAGVYALYQRLPGDGVLFNGAGDHVYYRMVADSVSRRWPDSRYVVALQREVEQMNAQVEMQSRIEGAPVSELGYPDIELPNMYGQGVRLSSMAGKVVVLDFWSATAVEGNLGNVALRELWDEFSGSGLDVYQVSLDTSKPLWVNAVQEQKLPWTTVCDFRGYGCMAARVWNVAGLPANFVIDREGNVVGRNLYGDALRAKIEGLL